MTAVPSIAEDPARPGRGAEATPQCRSLQGCAQNNTCLRRPSLAISFASMHIYHVTSGTPVATILRPARTPKGTEVRTVIKHATKRLRRHWPNTRIVWRGDSHYGRVEAMEWAEDNGADYIFGLAGNAALDAFVAEAADNLRFHHAMSSKAKLRTFACFTYQAGSWKRPRKVVARLECSLQPV